MHMMPILISLIIYIYMMNKRKQGDDKTVLK